MGNLFLFTFLISPILLVLGLVKPSIYQKVLRHHSTRKKTTLYNIILFISSFILFGVTVDSADYSTHPNKPSASATIQPTPTPTTTIKTEAQTTEDTPPVTGEKHLVTKVIDGDTIALDNGEVVRYIGIDSPETKHPSKPVECYGKEASDRNTQLIGGRKVLLEKDVSEVDKYDRLLRYIWLDGVLINEVLVKEGYANSSTYPPDVKYQERFNKAENEARNKGLGLWGEVCKVIPTATKAPVAPPVNVDSCKFDCNGPDRDCSDFSTQSEAQQFFNCCGFTVSNDPMRLDSIKEGDGVACESLP